MYFIECVFIIHFNGKGIWWWGGGGGSKFIWIAFSICPLIVCFYPLPTANPFHPQPVTSFFADGRPFKQVSTNIRVKPIINNLYIKNTIINIIKKGQWLLLGRTVFYSRPEQFRWFHKTRTETILDQFTTTTVSLLTCFFFPTIKLDILTRFYLENVVKKGKIFRNDFLGGLLCNCGVVKVTCEIHFVRIFL